MSPRLKPLENMARDVKEGDLIRIFLNASDYVGYRWDLNESQVKSQLIIPNNANILFCSLNPYGKTQDKRILDKVQFVGVNLKTHTLGDESIRGYKVLERTSYSKED